MVTLHEVGGTAGVTTVFISVFSEQLVLPFFQDRCVYGRRFYSERLDNDTLAQFPFFSFTEKKL